MTRTSGSLPVSEFWKELAMCQGLDPELFFDMGHKDQAKAICATCPVRVSCLNYALERIEPAGIWGGKTPGERVAVLVRAGVHVTKPILRQMGRDR